MATYKTNEQLLRALLKDLTTIEAALLRERLLKISEATRDAITKDASGFSTPLSTPNDFIRLCNKIDKHLKID